MLDVVDIRDENHANNNIWSPNAASLQATRRTLKSNLYLKPPVLKFEEHAKWETDQWTFAIKCGCVFDI